MASKPVTIDEYIAHAPTEAQPKLRKIREILKEVAPEAAEAIKWGTPVLIGKRILFSFSAHLTHINFMPTRTTLDRFKHVLKEFKTGRDTIQFPYDKPLPRALIKKIAMYRVKEVAEGSLWMHQAGKRKKIHLENLFGIS